MASFPKLVIHVYSLNSHMLMLFNKGCILFSKNKNNKILKLKINSA